MAKYQLTQSAYVNGQYLRADVRDPQVYELGDDVEPSLRWDPLDDAAKSALDKLRKKKVKLREMAANGEIPDSLVTPLYKDGPAPADVADEAAPHDTTKDKSGGYSKSKRASDKDL